MTKLRLAVIASAMAGTMAGSVAPALAAPAQPQAPPLNSTNIPAQYTDQQLDWHTCTADELGGKPPPEGAEDMECATYRAPRDWSRVGDNVDLNIAVSRLKATNDATSSVVTNPGGPGAPGRDFPAKLRNQGKLRANHEIIGLDPRGTGKSTNITCGGAIETGKSLDPRDRSEQNLNRILDATKYAAESCQAESGELGPLINTDQTVHDIDLLRVLLNRDKIDWIGYSAGTWLGAHYAQAFPDRTDKFVLDSNTEFTTTWQKSFDWQPMGFERRWREDFLPWLGKYDSTYHFGTTGEATRQTYEQVRYALTKKPIEVEGEQIGPNEFDSYISSQIYGKKAFPALAEFLVNARTLTGSDAPDQQRTDAAKQVKATLHGETFGPQPLRVPTDYDDAYDASFWTIPCNEGRWNGGPKDAIRQSDKLGKDYPLLGWGWMIQPCMYWDNQPAPLPVLDGKDVPPVLMVQSTHDPATPIEGAQRAHKAFANSRMLTVTGEGDHGIYASGNDGVDAVVEDYLVDGIVPEDKSLPGMPLPDPAAG